MLVKCICKNCAGHLEFEEENAGETIECPHCGFDTKLFMPGEDNDEPAPAGFLRRLNLRRLLFRFGPVLLVLGGIGYSLFKWVLPPLSRDWLPLTESPVLPIMVMLFGCALFIGAFVWLAFPVLFLFRLRQMTEILEGIERNLRLTFPQMPAPVEEDFAESPSKEVELPAERRPGAGASRERQ